MVLALAYLKYALLLLLLNSTDFPVLASLLLRVEFASIIAFDDEVSAHKQEYNTRLLTFCELRKSLSLVHDFVCQKRNGAGCRQVVRIFDMMKSAVLLSETIHY